MEDMKQHTEESHKRKRKRRKKKKRKRKVTGWLFLIGVIIIVVGFMWLTC